MSRRTTGVDDALRDPLVVEVRDLLPQVMVLQQHRPTGTRLQRVVRVVQPDPLRSRQPLPALRHLLLRDPGLLAGRAVCVRTPLIGLGRQRTCRLDGLVHRRLHRTRRPRNLVPGPDGVLDLLNHLLGGGLHWVLLLAHHLFPSLRGVSAVSGAVRSRQRCTQSGTTALPTSQQELGLPVFEQTRSVNRERHIDVETGLGGQERPDHLVL